MVFLSGSEVIMQAEAQDVPTFAPVFQQSSSISSQCSCCWCCEPCQLQIRNKRRKERRISSSDQHLGSSPAKMRYHRSSSIRNGSSDYLDSGVQSALDSPHLAESVLALKVTCACGGKTEGFTEELCRQCEENQNNIVPDYLSPIFQQNNRLSLSSSSEDVSQKSEIVHVDTENDEVQSQFVNAFLHNNRLEHVTQVIGYHPQYLESFLKTQQYLLRGDGPLPYDYRHYIAIMAAGRHQCSYLVHIQSTEFLLQGGDERWLKGLEHAPKKLQDLCELNKVMAHRPWLISKCQIEKLTRGDDNWSLSELMHAIVIIAHFHALSSFVYGCGISAETDQDEGHTYRPASSGNTPISGSPQSHTPNSHPDGEIATLLKKMEEIQKDKQQEMTEQELLEQFQVVEKQSVELPASTRQPSPRADILRYVEDAGFTYEDFAKRDSTTELPTFRAQDYSWADHGFSLANRLYTDIGNLLDEKFRIAYNLTYYTMGDNQDVDTSSFRQAIWYYIQCMFGIRHDDYNYSEINQLLERNLKSYVKTTTCFPERVTKKDYDSFMREFKHSEKVHVNLMLFEARLQAELLYSLRALMRHMT